MKVEFRKLKSGFMVVFNRKVPETGLVEGLAERLVESQQKILKLIAQNSSISKRRMAEILVISDTAVDKNIATLKKKGLLRRVGPVQGGHWEIVEQ